MHMCMVMYMKIIDHSNIHFPLLLNIIFTYNNIFTYISYNNIVIYVTCLNQN